MTLTRRDGSAGTAALLVVALLGLALRVAPLLGPGGPLAAPVAYDDGVYFSASALLLRGVLPYRDFFFVHPPGILYVFGITSWLPDPATAFVAMRFLICIAGAINILLIATLVRRAAGLVPAIVAALLYALHPDVVAAERSTYLEPVLNFFVLLTMLLRTTRPVVAGILGAAACAVKFWGGIWIVAALAIPKDRLRFFAAAAIAGLAFVAPFLSQEFFAQTLGFQMARPPDGIFGVLPRLRSMLDAGHLAASTLACIGVFSRRARPFAIAMLLTMAGFLASSSYWNHYNSHLAVSQCVLAGFGVALLMRMPRLAFAIAIATILAIGLRLPHLPQERLTLDVPQGGSLFAFYPAWSLVANRLPPHGDGAPVIVDSYGLMMNTTRRWPDTVAAWQNPEPRLDIRARLAASDFVILGWRGNLQLNAADRAWFAQRFVRVNPAAGDLAIWRAAGATSSPR